MTATRKPFLVGTKEFGAIYGIPPLRISQRLSRGQLDNTFAVTVSGSPYWLADFARRWGATTPKGTPLREDVMDEVVEQQQPGFWAATVDEVPPLVGLQELTALFGLPSQQAAATHARSPRFPTPDYRLSGSRIWLLDTLVGAAPSLQATSRSQAWQVDPEVEAALREKRYEGPGSAVKKRGPAARAAASSDLDTPGRFA